MTKKALLVLAFLLLWLPGAQAASGDALRVGLVVFEGDTLFDSYFYETVRSALEKAVRTNYLVEGAFEMIQEDRRAYMDALDRQGEEYMISYLAGRNLDLVLFGEMSTDGHQVVFKGYRKNGLFDDFYLPYSAGLDRFLPEVSVGTFLGLIEKLDGHLFDNRRY